MKVTAERKDFRFSPDSSRVVARFFWNGKERTEKMIDRVLSMGEEQVKLTLEQTLREFASRHRNISKIFHKHFEKIQELIKIKNDLYDSLSDFQKMLIGSYCTMEYSIESAAIFNPSIIKDFDQSYLEEGEMRVILSFRATGEGHISSIVFRRAIIDKNNNLQVMKSGDQIDLAEVTHKRLYDKNRFIKKLTEMNIPKKYSKSIMEDLPDNFEYYSLTTAVAKILNDKAISMERRMALNEMTWLVDSFYDVQFQMDSDLTERVLFPISNSESRGIEDARFVNFTESNGTEKVYATYSAYNGHNTLPKLLSTEDFYTFRVMPLHGEGAQNKNLALFPKKIKGKYAMLARIDGVNNYIMFSDKSTLWNSPMKIQEPQFPWEYTQIGNCGSPIWTKEGWLIITHGVGPMRRYSIGASLLDLEDPTIEIGRLKEPLLTPLEKERDGYVPNVVYSCGAIIHNANLILPYAVSDYSSTYAVISMDELLEALKNY
ncbi:glycoside hydrolase family 130 protein [Echinicola sp. CAU 1574]|uniref:Glycoside hydrolase family 130 protein n=1 Tax=Echinicola arenosa TaxID=2774144 RepID=A0ABR9AHG4_9BACT|nr:glycoside hydrolase family 130 protein [Echinicola arenosa]MBD8488228.1 glycoside hydrolase family 130 protein [Echinicola arenosa]